MHTAFPTKNGRQGSTVVLQSSPIDISMTTSTVKKITLGASLTKPLKVTFSLLTLTAFNGTTPTVDVGTSTTATEIFNAITPAAAGLAYGTPVTKLFIADTDIYFKFAGGGSNTTGAGYVTMDCSQINVSLT